MNFKAATDNWPRTWRAGKEAECRAILDAVYVANGAGKILDLGCRRAQLTRHLPGVFCDVDPVADGPDNVIKLDIRTAPHHFYGQRFNMVIMTDVIEHLLRDEGEALMAGMSHLCDAMYIFTPTGPWCTSDGTLPHEHRSGWYPEQFFNRRWHVWEWPAFHRFQDGSVHGAFFAWKKAAWTGPDGMDVKSISEHSGVPL